MYAMTLTPNLIRARACLHYAGRALDQLLAWLEDGNSTRDYDDVAPDAREALQRSGVALDDTYLLAGVCDAVNVCTMLQAMLGADEEDYPGLDLPAPETAAEDPEALAVGADFLEMAADLIDAEADEQAEGILAGVAAAARSAASYTSEAYCGSGSDADRQARLLALLDDAGVLPVEADEPTLLPRNDA